MTTTTYMVNQTEAKDHSEMLDAITAGIAALNTMVDFSAMCGLPADEIRKHAKHLHTLHQRYCTDETARVELDRVKSERDRMKKSLEELLNTYAPNEYGDWVRRTVKAALEGGAS